MTYWAHMYLRNPTHGYTSLHCSDIRHLHSAPKHRYNPYARPCSKPLSWSKANNWEWFPYNSTNQVNNERQSTKTRNPDVRAYMCAPQRQAVSSHARDSESCSKQSCAKSWPTTKFTHKLIIYAYHESQN